jgi:ABC-type glycerol-3-phosphate transport system substrate-binding protein
MKLRQFTVIVITILVSVSAIGVGYAQDKGKSGSEGITQLYNAAKKEGTVVIWGPTDAVIYQKAQEALNKKYPGIKIEHFESIPEPLVQRTHSSAVPESTRILLSKVAIRAKFNMP